MISVCMACYNGHKYIRQQIDSILCQLSEEDELIISDDGSKDNTCAIIQNYNDSRIKLVHNQTNHGFIGNFENALREAKGDYIFLSDQDDYWKAGKIKTVIPQLQNYQLVIHDAELVDGEGKSLNKRYYECMHSKKGFFANLWKTRWLGCCMAFRKELLDYCLPFPKGIVGHDHWISTIGMFKFKYSYMPDVLMCYRRHGDNISPSGEKSNTSWAYKIKKRIGVMILLMIRITSKAIRK